MGTGREGAAAPSVGWPEIIPVPGNFQALLSVLARCGQELPDDSVFMQGQRNAFRLACVWLAEEIAATATWAGTGEEWRQIARRYHDIIGL